MEKGETYTGQYLDYFLYPHISRAFERNTDDLTNKRGIDVYLTGGTRVITIDEKCTCLYVNCESTLDKGALELTYINDSGKVIDSWMLNNGINTHIGYCWVDSATTVSEYSTAKGMRYRLIGSGITDCTVAIIPKERLFEALSDMGLNVGKLRENAAIVREMFNRYGKGYYYHIEKHTIEVDGYHYSIQLTQPEHAVNIHLGRDRLIGLSDYACRIRNNKVERLK